MSLKSRRVTRIKAAIAASKVLRDKRSAKDSKTAAASTLSQVKPEKFTGKRAASAASRTLRQRFVSIKSRTSAASALAQKRRTRNLRRTNRT